MRGVETRIQEIRHRIFREVARMAYHTEWPVDKRIEELPYKIIPGEVGNFRNDVFLERAIVGERLRLAMGLPCRGAGEHAPLSDNIEAADRAETYYTPPLINVIKFACNACHEKRVYVTDGCQGCLAHPCVEVCPKGAVRTQPCPATGWWTASAAPRRPSTPLPPAPSGPCWRRRVWPFAWTARWIWNSASGHRNHKNMRRAAFAALLCSFLTASGCCMPQCRGPGPPWPAADPPASGYKPAGPRPGPCRGCRRSPRRVRT